jgi:hypothetical protein
VRAYLWRRDSCWALRGKLIERAVVLLLLLLGPFTHIAQQQEKRVAEQFAQSARRRLPLQKLNKYTAAVCDYAFRSYYAPVASECMRLFISFHKRASQQIGSR